MALTDPEKPPVLVGDAMVLVDEGALYGFAGVDEDVLELDVVEMDVLELVLEG